MIEKFVLVGLGGFLGSVLRYAAGGALVRIRPGASFPYETLVINATGCLLIGVLASLSDSRGLPGSQLRLFLVIGVLGGFTTFSAFGYETFHLLRDRQLATAIASVGLQILLGTAAVWLGAVLVRIILGR